MQVMPDTAEIFGVEAEELWDPDTNIAVGSAYLGRLAHRFRKDVPEMVAAYNAGPTRALNGHPLPRETVLYRRCVNRWYQRFRKVGGRARPAKGPS
jgi:soluble lytic murein transglycosylase-like protein